MQKIDTIRGLTQQQADKILKLDGFNELPSQKKRGGFFVLLKVLSEPMLLLLIGSGVIYLFLGEAKDALMLLTFVFVVIGITFYQERKTEKTLQALKDLSSPRALVIRDGEQKRIAGREVVNGDMIIIREGDRVPADAVVISCENLTADESLLTGESVPVRKAEATEDVAVHKPGGDDLPFIYSSSLITSGRGIARVIATGPRTEIGKIGKNLERIKPEDTLLHKETSKIVRLVAVGSLMLCAVVVIAYSIIKKNILGGFLAGITLSMAMLPEEFPVVLVIFLTLGAWRISKRKVLTRHAAAIETLGAATVLCADKTGTLTMNKMELATLFAADSFYEISDYAEATLPQPCHPLLECSLLASHQDPFDPMEKEINKIGGRFLGYVEDPRINSTIVKEYPPTKKLFAITHALQFKEEKKLRIVSKGAPEAILELCHVNVDFRQNILDRVTEMSKRGLRVLGAAEADFSSTTLPPDQHSFEFQFVGLLGFIDPVRPTVIDAITEAHAAGIRVMVITGDYPGTAQFVARKIGIENTEQYLTGEDLEKMDHTELEEKIKTINIFARIVPEQKLLIVNALKANNEIVAMTGDGVNDAPALKAAHIGIAMGERGTDVAREASALVLLNDDFSSIVAAIRLGRRIYDNMKQAMGYILAVHIPIAGMSILPIIFNLPAVLLPAHIAFLELIIDPACSIVFESGKEEKDIMRRRPRNLHQSIFNFKTVSVSMIQGLGVLIAAFILLIFALYTSRSTAEARSFAFAALVMGNIMLIAINLSWSQNLHQIVLTASRIFFIVCAGALLCLLAVLYLPFFANLFYLAPLHPADLIFIGAAVFASLMWFEIMKLLQNNVTNGVLNGTLKMIIGVALIILGILLHLIPLFPAGWIIILGLELVGIRLLLPSKKIHEKSRKNVSLDH